MNFCEFGTSPNWSDNYQNDYKDLFGLNSQILFLVDQQLIEDKKLLDLTLIWAKNRQGFRTHQAFFYLQVRPKQTLRLKDFTV